MVFPAGFELLQILNKPIGVDIASIHLNHSPNSLFWSLSQELSFENVKVKSLSHCARGKFTNTCPLSKLVSACFSLLNFKLEREFVRSCLSFLKQ